MSKQELNHALRYAREATKEFLMERYRTYYPHIFQHAVLEKRPATSRDYFIPPTLAKKCMVVTRTYFKEMGCLQLSCFPMKRNLEVCTEQDAPRYEQIGHRFYLACQPICHNQNNPVDAEWVRGKCLLANPLKKMLAMFPEQLFERSSRHVFHGGLELVEGELTLNNTYCEAYGLDFKKDDCHLSTGQSVAEWFLGRTPYRAIKTANLKPWAKKNKPPLPRYLLNAVIARKRRTRAVVVEEAIDKKLFNEMMRDLAMDYGIDVSAAGLELFLRKKAPGLLSKAVNHLPIRVALKEAVRNAVIPFGTQSLSMAVGAAGSVYAIYNLVSLILDALDPFDYKDRKSVV